jgi:hypothetical protein
VRGWPRPAAPGARLGKADAGSCTVETDEAEPGSEVVLTPTCEVPDETTQDAETAQMEFEGSGFSVTFDPEPSDPANCTVED